MDLTNRILIISGMFLWIFVVIMVILLAWGAPDESIERIADLAVYLEDHNDFAGQLILTFGAAILVLLAAIVVITEVAPSETKSLKVANVGSGEARIPTDEVAHLVEAELRMLPQLNEVVATVQARGDKADVSLELHVGPEADIAATTDEACRRTSELLAQRIGVELARPPRAQLHYKELRVTRKQAKSPPPASSAPRQTTIQPPKPASETESPASPAPGAESPASGKEQADASQTTSKDRTPGA